MSNSFVAFREKEGCRCHDQIAISEEYGRGFAEMKNHFNFSTTVLLFQLS